MSPRKADSSSGAKVKEALTTDEKFLAAILMDESGLDLAEFTWVDDSNVETKKHRCYRAYPYQWAWWRCKDQKQIDQCVAAGQRITTLRGQIPIEDVEPGDEVLTHRGRFRTVVDVHYKGRAETVRVRAGGHAGVVITPGHRIYSRATLADGATWDEPAIGAWWAVPAPTSESGDIYGHRWERITSIDPEGECDVYDLEVTEDHSFVAEGVVVSNCGRSVGKSERIMARVCAFPFNYPGLEMVLIAPEGKHVDAITNRIEAKVRQSRMLTYMLVGGSWTNGINHRPFQLNFENSKFYTRLPGRDGKGVKGIHPAVLEVDEGQDISQATWKELPEVLRTDLRDKVRWLVHGVSKGVRDAFYDLTYNSDWTVHRITGIHRPDWNEEDKKEKLKLYGGSEESPDYKRNVLGLHGDSMNRIFVLSRLMHCVDDTHSDYNANEYFLRNVNFEQVQERAGYVARAAGEPAPTSEHLTEALLELVEFPLTHLTTYTGGIFWAGMDVGLVNDPSELVVAVEYEPSADERSRDGARKIAVPDKGLTRMKILARVSLLRIPNPLQVELILTLIDHYRPRAFSMDGTGIGLPLYQDVQARAGRSKLAVAAPPPDASDLERLAFYAAQAKAASALTILKSYNFGEKVLVGFRDEEIDKLGPGATMEDIIDKAGIRRHAKDEATDVLRNKLVDVRRLMLPNDPEITNQMNGQSWGFSQEPIDAYGNRRMSFSSGEFHILDGMRMLALGWSMESMEQMTASRPVAQRDVLDNFG